MSSVKSMLIYEFNKEFEELNQYFLNVVYPNLKLDLEGDSFSDYDIEKINQIFGPLRRKFKSDDDLLQALYLLLDEGCSPIIANRNHSLLYIPIFVYFLKHGLTRSAEFYELCMRIHLSKDKIKLFQDDGLKKLKVPFRAGMADTLEMVLLASDFSTDLRTVINLLDYIDYERFINGANDSEYSKYLQMAEKELLAYVSFLASDELLEEFYKNREGSTRDYKYTKFRFNKDTLKLMSYYIDTDVKECKNKFLEFKLLEERLKNGIDIDSRRSNMLVAFTYRTYPSNDFYDCFSDIELTMWDLIEFINHCEELEIILSPRQLDNLLTSYRNRYLDINGLTDEYHSLCYSVKEAFDEYRKTRYAFLPNEFIRYYNSRYRNDFKSFNFGTSTPLTRDIYELIINDNNLIGFSYLSHSKSWERYISNLAICTQCSSNDNLNYERDKFIYDKYYQLLEESLFTSEFTIDYIIRKNVVEEDLELFMKLKKWFDKYSFEKWDYSNRVKVRTFNQLQVDFDEELRNSPFNQRFEILYKYNGYVVHDQIDELITPRFFYKPMHEYEKEFIENNGLSMFEIVMSAYDAGKDLLPILEELGLAIEDINLVFDSLGQGFSAKAVYFKRKALEEVSILQEKRKKEEQDSNKEETLSVLTAFLNDNRAHTIYEFCKLNNVSINQFSNIRALIKEHPELQQTYEEKLGKLKNGDCDLNDDYIEEIYHDLIYGIRREDGTIRPFDYLDYRLRTDMPLLEFGKLMRGRSEFSFIKRFIASNKELTKYTDDFIFQEKFVIRVNGELHEVTHDEKQMALNFIEQMNLPHEYKLYSLAVKGFLSGDLDLRENSHGDKVFVKKDKG